MNDFFLIGKIKSVAKDYGFLIVLPFTDDLNRFSVLKKVFIDVFGGLRQFFVEDVSIEEKSIALKFKNFDSPEDVDFLVGRDILVSSQDSVDLDEDSFFIHDLVGCEVFRNDEFFGKVKEVYNLPANDVISVETENGEVLLPFINDYVKNVDIGNHRIDLVDGEGDLFDDED
ncbi:MAG: 16S rRNA processing protein RimM [Ignavibacteria bacterium]|nr:MAG: 16S rRNA processing protein RimM [Ignavibacteria bacterium]